MGGGVSGWTDYAESAGLTDKAQINNVGRWIREDDAFAVVGLRTGKAFAVADALTPARAKTGASFLVRRSVRGTGTPEYRSGSGGGRVSNRHDT